LAGLRELLAGTNLVVLAGVLIFFFVVQGLGAIWQSKRMLGAVKDLYQHGTVAVGMAGNIYKRKVYGFLVADDQGTIVKARLLKGWTIFARPRPVEALIGLELSDLLVESPQIKGVSRKAMQAFAMAAASLRDRLQEQKDEVSVEAQVSEVQ
jgi:glucitol operon activator protein